MSWLLENWFGSKESLEQVSEEIQEHLQKESYLGVSGLEQPELSANRVNSKELSLILNGPWENKLEDVEEELLQYIHDQLPPVVRDEVGIVPFFTNVLAEGYLVLAFIRNASKRDILIQKLPLALVTPEGEVVARKSFNLVSQGAIGDFSSRAFDFLFHWNEFIRIPEKEVQLTLVYEGRPKKQAVTPDLYKDTNGLAEDEVAKYMQIASDKVKPEPGKVDLKVLEITSAEAGGLKVVVLFRNGMDKRLAFTEVPMTISTKNGQEVAQMFYELNGMYVDALSSRMWSFIVPKDSLKKTDVDPQDCIAHIPQPEDQTEKSKGMVQ